MMSNKFRTLFYNRWRIHLLPGKLKGLKMKLQFMKFKCWKKECRKRNSLRNNFRPLWIEFSWVKKGRKLEAHQGITVIQKIRKYRHGKCRRKVVKSINRNQCNSLAHLKKMLCHRNRNQGQRCKALLTLQKLTNQIS